MAHYVMKIPYHLKNKVEDLIRKDKSRKPVRVNRRLRITPVQLVAATRELHQFKKLGKSLARFAERLDGEYDRLEAMLDHPRTKEDEAWIDTRLNWLDNIRQKFDPENY